MQSRGQKQSLFRAVDAGHQQLCSETVDDAGPEAAVARIASLLTSHGFAAPAAIGHRIVHGGPGHRRHALIDSDLIRDLEAAIGFAPVHLPPSLAIIRSARSRYPDCRHIACFDTEYHADMPEVARTLPIPKALGRLGIRRYGFHGLSCQSIVRQLGKDLPDRLIVAHLGHGVSITAIRAGQSVDNSMGLTPSGGAIMGTRTGDIDPGVLLHLLRSGAHDADSLERLFNAQSGLLGISGTSSDMRQLHQAARTDADAALAIDMFCVAVRKQIAAMISVLNGVNIIVFTGGIGENDAEIRARICGGLSWAGIRIDRDRNESATNPLSLAMANTRIMVLPSQEDDEIARQTWGLVAAQDGASASLSQTT